MTRGKVTLSVDEQLIREAKAFLARKDMTMSGVVEDFLRSLVTPAAIEGMMGELQIERKYVSFEDVIKNRLVGLDAGKIIREMRNEREKSLS